ncbi:N-acetyltransferase [Paenibacillus allorhizosphaerae]|uniref:Amino-acid acetyltransferase n=1 Tax=Paenibacillus allorhizosphaerae TaxID=2849866 RepID=A0ABN7TGR0_9BACL|nr:N-acetyltransferase [Paenibacillus allorhizosphaerae]CAG7619792.1 Amino-acid acetyltransferase [Paenibacillus allorhizosphaerae]
MYQIRKATMQDTEKMYQLIRTYADEGKLLHRTLSSLYEHLQCFFVAEQEGEVVGTVSLHILDKDLAEVRSLTVSSTLFGMGIGKNLVTAVINESKSLGVQTILSLTYQVDFFQKCGFQLVDKKQLPMPKVWKDCVHCSKFSNCDENAMIIHIL